MDAKFWFEVQNMFPELRDSRSTCTPTTVFRIKACTVYSGQLFWPKIVLGERTTGVPRIRSLLRSIVRWRPQDERPHEASSPPHVEVSRFRLRHAAGNMKQQNQRTAVYPKCLLFFHFLEALEPVSATTTTASPSEHAFPLPPGPTTPLRSLQPPEVNTKC